MSDILICTDKVPIHPFPRHIKKERLDFYVPKGSSWLSVISLIAICSNHN